MLYYSSTILTRPARETFVGGPARAARYDDVRVVACPDADTFAGTGLYMELPTVPVNRFGDRSAVHWTELAERVSDRHHRIGVDLRW
jgi:hypothetical protein